MCPTDQNSWKNLQTLRKRQPHKYLISVCTIAASALVIHFVTQMGKVVFDLKLEVSKIFNDSSSKFCISGDVENVPSVSKNGTKIQQSFPAITPI